MSATNRAERLCNRIRQNTPDELADEAVSTTHEPVEATGDLETYVLVELPTPPERHASADELRDLTDEQADRLHGAKEQHYNEVRDYVTSVVAVVQNLAGDEHEVVGFNEFATTTPSQTQYYAVRICNDA